MRWAIERDADGTPSALVWLGPESGEEREAREAEEKRRRVAMKTKVYPEALEWARRRGMLDEDGCLRTTPRSRSTNVGREVPSCAVDLFGGVEDGRGAETGTDSSRTARPGRDSSSTSGH